MDYLSRENRVPFYLLQTLHSIRLKHGMSTTEIAKKLGINENDYKAWENDSSHIPYQYILKLEKTFQMPSRYIYFGSDITLYNQKTICKACLFKKSFIFTRFPNGKT